MRAPLLVTVVQRTPRLSVKLTAHVALTGNVLEITEGDGSVRFRILLDSSLRLTSSSGRVKIKCASGAWNANQNPSVAVEKCTLDCAGDSDEVESWCAAFGGVKPGKQCWYSGRWEPHSISITRSSSSAQPVITSCHSPERDGIQCTCQMKECCVCVPAKAKLKSRKSLFKLSTRKGGGDGRAALHRILLKSQPRLINDSADVFNVPNWASMMALCVGVGASKSLPIILRPFAVGPGTADWDVLPVTLKIRDVPDSYLYRDSLSVWMLKCSPVVLLVDARAMGETHEVDRVLWWINAVNAETEGRNPIMLVAVHANEDGPLLRSKQLAFEAEIRQHFEQATAAGRESKSDSSPQHLRPVIWSPIETGRPYI